MGGEGVAEGVELAVALVVHTELQRLAGRAVVHLLQLRGTQAPNDTAGENGSALRGTGVL